MVSCRGLAASGLALALLLLGGVALLETRVEAPAAGLNLQAQEASEEERKHDVEGQLEQVKRSQNVCISLMLLGGVGFMMGTFYLVNWPDPDIKRASWQVISSTISIFSAVLMFQACNGVLEYYFLEDMYIWWQLVVDMAHMLLWLMITQFVIAYFSGAVGEHESVQRHRKAIETRSNPSTSPKSMIMRVESAHLHQKDIELNTKCWSILLGHICGFAAINAWGTLQQALPHTLFYSSLVTPMAAFFIYCVYQITDALRQKIAGQDDVVDDFEKAWAEAVAETEDDVMSLAVSFLSVQVLRFAITGSLPNAEGEDPEGMIVPLKACALLMLAGFLLGSFESVKVGVRKLLFKPQEKLAHHHGEESGEEEEEENRVLEWIRDILAMCTAWCIHFSVEWWCARIFLDQDGTVLSVVCALVVTSLAFSLIFVLDKLADAEWTDDEVDQSLRALIHSLGILVGFSWERSFDAAVGGLSKDGIMGLAPPFVKLVLAVTLAGMVMPAWKMYILPEIHKLEEEEKKHHKTPESGVPQLPLEPSPFGELSRPLLQNNNAAFFSHHLPEVQYHGEYSRQVSPSNGDAAGQLEELRRTAAELEELRRAEHANLEQVRRLRSSLAAGAESLQRRAAALEQDGLDSEQKSQAAAELEELRRAEQANLQQVRSLRGTLAASVDALRRRAAELELRHVDGAASPGSQSANTGIGPADAAQISELRASVAASCEALARRAADLEQELAELGPHGVSGLEERSEADLQAYQDRIAELEASLAQKVGQGVAEAQAQAELRAGLAKLEEVLAGFEQREQEHLFRIRSLEAAAEPSPQADAAEGEQQKELERLRQVEGNYLACIEQLKADLNMSMTELEHRSGQLQALEAELGATQGQAGEAERAWQEQQADLIKAVEDRDAQLRHLEELQHRVQDGSQQELARSNAEALLLREKLAKTTAKVDEAMERMQFLDKENLRLRDEASQAQNELLRASADPARTSPKSPTLSPTSRVAQPGTSGSWPSVQQALPPATVQYGPSWAAAPPTQCNLTASYQPGSLQVPPAAATSLPGSFGAVPALLPSPPAVQFQTASSPASQRTLGQMQPVHPAVLPSPAATASFGADRLIRSAGPGQADFWTSPRLQSALQSRTQMNGGRMLDPSRVTSAGATSSSIEGLGSTRVVSHPPAFHSVTRSAN